MPCSGAPKRDDNHGDATIFAVCAFVKITSLRRKIKLLVIPMITALDWAWLSRKALLAHTNGGLPATFSHDGATWQAIARCTRFRSLNSVARSVDRHFGDLTVRGTAHTVGA